MVYEVAGPSVVTEFTGISYFLFNLCLLQMRPGILGTQHIRATDVGGHNAVRFVRRLRLACNQVIRLH